MKKIYKLFSALALMCLSINIINAQCIQTFQFPSTTLTVNGNAGTNSVISTSQWAGDYSIENFTLAATYTISSSIPTDYFTVTDNANNILAAGSGTSVLSVAIPSVGLYRIHVSTSSACGTQNSNRTVTVGRPPCIQTVQYPSGTLTVNGTPGTSSVITTIQYAGEYSVENFTAAATYTVSSSIPTDYFTITDNANNMIAGGSGNSVLSFTIPSAGLYRIHVSLNGTTCGIQNSSRTIIVGRPPVPCSSAPASTVVASASTLCPGASLTLSTNVTYTGTGITYQWQSSSAFAGPYSAISGATLATLATTAPTVATFYNLIASCTVVPVTATASPVQINVGAPMVTATTPQTLICGSNAPLSFTPSVSGVNYQWQSSNVLPGPYLAISGGTTAAFTATGITAPTFFNIMLTCSTNTAFTSVSNTLNITPAATTTNSVPYFEGFEGVTAGNTPTNFPNCSWFKTGDYATATTTLSYNRMPQTGIGYAYTAWSTITGGDHMYTNGIQLNTGVTYSASVGYITDGISGWADFSMLLATAQNTSAITNTISSVSAPTNTVYATLTNTFTVPSSGLYHLAFRVNANSTPWYLSMDNISLTAPCSINSPSINVSGGSSAICAGNTTSLNASGANTYSWSSGQTTSNVAVSPSVTTNYIVTGTNAASCSNTAAVTVTVNNAPAITITGTTSVCAGNSVNLSASGASTYTWNTGANTASISATPTANVTYTAMGTGTNGCNGMATQAVTVNALPTVSASASSATACASTSVALTGSPSGGTFSGANVTGNTFNSSSTGTFMPMYAFTNSVTGCSNTASTTIVVSSCTVTSINKNGSFSSNLIAYPNPNQGNFTIELANGLSKTIQVSDLTGRVILETTSVENTINVTISNLANGVYYVKVISNNAIEVLKVVKQ